MNLTKLAAAAVLGGVMCGGCAKDAKSEDAAAAQTPAAIATPPAASPTIKPSSPVVTAPTPAAATTVPDKDMTHVLTKDEAYYAMSPAQAKNPDGTLKAGTKVVVLMPRGSYSQVMTADGKRVYTTTASLAPVGK